jgi:membrane protein DedA with SNARE-associated domain
MNPQLLAMTEHYGLLIVFAVVLIGQIGVPIPAIVLLIGAGTLAMDGGISAAGVFATTMAACVIADCGLFILGQRYGIRALQRMHLISASSDSPVSQRFERWGARSLVIAKFVPGLSTLAPTLAGALRMSRSRFVLLSGVGSVLWAATGLGVGWVFAEQVPYLLTHLARIGRLVAVASMSAAGAYLVYRYLNRRKSFGHSDDRRAVRPARHAPVGP